MISIHALREEGDGMSHEFLSDLIRFLSTPSARRATASACQFFPFTPISIHALREEGDMSITINARDSK